MVLAAVSVLDLNQNSGFGLTLQSRGYPAKSSASIFVKTRRKHSFDLEMVGNEIYYCSVCLKTLSHFEKELYEPRTTDASQILYSLKPYPKLK